MRNKDDWAVCFPLMPKGKEQALLVSKILVIITGVRYGVSLGDWFKAKVDYVIDSLGA